MMRPNARASHAVAPSQSLPKLHIVAASKSQMGRFQGMNAGEDQSDDQVSSETVGGLLRADCVDLSLYLYVFLIRDVIE